VVTTTAGSTSFTEDGGAVVVDAGVTVTDPDDTNLVSATVSITNVLDAGSEQLAATACGALAVGGSGTPTLTISGTQPLAVYQTCLQSVTYNNTDQDPDATARVISFVANDGTNSSAPANKTVTVTPVNDAPVVTTTGGTTAFTEGGGAIVVDAGVTVTDVDNANLASATVTITNVLDAGSEQLAATACGALTVGGSGTATLTISGSQPLTTYQTCLRSVTYDNTDQDPDTTNRVISFVANDGTANSAPANKTVSVAAVNNAPVVTTTGGSTAFTEDGGAVTIDSGLTVTDADSANLASATVTITNVQDVGFEALAATSCAGLTVGGSGTATLSISGSQPLATYQTCLRSVTYNNTDQDPNNTARVISFVANDGTNNSNTANKTVTVAPVNDAPVVTTTGGTTAFTEDGGPVTIDSGLTVTDVDSANLASATVSITNVQDVGSEALAATACGGLTVGGSGTATLTISGSQTLATYQTCLRSVTYNDTDQDPNTTTRVISFLANDGAASSAPANKSVSVAAVNDAPVVTTTGGSTSFTEGGGAVVVDSGVTVTDVDSPNLASATVTITNVQDVGFEALAATACGALTVGGSGTPTLTITGSQPPATYQACLQSVTYNNTDLDPGTTARVISFVANDGALPSNTANKTVTVTAVNSAPVVTTTGGTTAFIEDAGAVVVDNGVTVTDVDSANLASATVTITNLQDGAFEQLNATSCAGLTVGGAGTSILAISGSQPPATYQTCLRSVTYNDTSDTPNTTTRVISFVASDGAASSAPATKNVSVTPSNDAPIVVTTAGNTAFTEDGGAVVVDSGVTVVDPDSGNLASATVTITNVLNVGSEALAATACGAFTVGGSGTPTLTITGSQTPAAYQSCLQSVTYNNTSQTPNTTTRVISFVANDGALSSAPATKNVTVTAVNDAPVVTTTGGTTAFTEDAGAVVIDSGVTVTDVDSANLASATVTITNVLDGASEQLTATACGALTVSGSGTSTLNISGSQPLATYQACLQSARYNNTSNNPSTTTRVISFVANDGALSSAPATKNVSVTAVNDAPVVTTTGGNTSFTEDAGAVVVDSGVTVSDVDNANLASATVTITNVQDAGFESLAATACGAFTVGGSGTATLTITGSQPLATYQTCLQSVTYNNTDQDPAGAPNRVVRFVVNDGTSNSNNGDKTVTVTPVNDAPVVTTSGGATSFTEDGGAVVVDNALTVTDVDNANLTSATVTITNVLDVSFESLAATSCAGLTVTGGGTTALSISGSQPKATYQTCLRSVTYNNLDQDPNATTRVVRFVVNDGALNSNNGDKQVTVTPVNDLPVCANTVNYTTPGNTQLHVNATTPGVAAWTDSTSLLAKCSPTDPDGPAATTVVTGSGSSANGGTFTISNAAAGDFFFVPAVGFTGADTFTFQLSDGAGTNNQTANVAVGQRVWYIRDVIDANNAAGGDGRSTNAFDSVAAFNAATTNDGDIIYVFAGNTATTPHSGSITLRNGQKLWGQGIALDVPGFGTSLVAASTQARIRSTVASTNTVNVPATAGNRQNVEIRGLDLEATGATSNAIDVTATGANTIGVTISNDTIRGATSEGIDVNQGSTSITATLALASNTLTSSGAAADVQNTAGTLTITAFNDNVVTGTSVGGITVAGSANPVVFDVTPGGAIQPVPGGNTQIGASGDHIAGNGLVLSNVTGALNFATDLDIFTDSGAALSVTGGTGGFDFDVLANAGTLVATAGPAAAISAADITLQLNSLTSTTSTNGVSLTTVSGTFSAPSGSSITKSSGGGTAFSVDNSAAGTTVLTATYGGTITSSAGRSVSINNADSGSSVAFTGQVSDTGQGISLTTNTGATISFRGGLTASTGANAAFAATGGGTVEVCDENPCNAGATGALVNTLTTTTGTALTVTNTTISANNIELRSVAANGAVNGILLNNTGGSGGLKVKANGGSCSSVGTCTGGAIQNTTADGVLLLTTTNPSLSNMAIVDAADSGISIDAVSGLSLTNLWMDSNGAQAEGGAIQDSGIHIEDLIGSANTITNSTVQESRNTNLDWDPNSSSGQSVLTVTGTNLNHAGEGVVGQGNAGINLTATGSANVKLVVNGGQVKNNAAAGILITGGAGTTVFSDIDAVDMVSSAPPVDPSGATWGNGVGTNFGISISSTGNSIQRHDITNVQLAYTGIAPNDGGSASALSFVPAGTGTFDINITGNTIGLVGAPRSGNENFFGIAGDLQDSPTVKANVSSNIIRNTALNGIFIQTRDPSAVAGNIDADVTVRSNTVGPISDDDDFPFGAGPNQAETHAIRIEARNDSNLCVDINGNSADGEGGNQDYLVRQRDTSTYNLERLTGNAADDTNIQNFIVGQNPTPAGQTARSTHATTYTAVADGTCQNPLAP
jgi:hypothetical protein